MASWDHMSFSTKVLAHFYVEDCITISILVGAWQFFDIATMFLEGNMGIFHFFANSIPPEVATILSIELLCLLYFFVFKYQICEFKFNIWI